MHIRYSPFINVEGEIKGLTADLDGNVTLTVTVKGKSATIVMTVDEAKKFFDELKVIDIEGLAVLYGQ